MGRDKSEDGSESAGEMFPKEPSQAELDADRAANPDTSEDQSKDGSGGA